MGIITRVLFGLCATSIVLSPLASAAPPPNPMPAGLVFQNISYLERNIDVPLDWAEPAGPQITVVARVHNPQAMDKPFFFFVGGGPAMESINAYSAVAQGYGYDRHLSELSKSHRVVTFDPRGFGRSTPLDRHSVAMDPVLLHRLFSAPAVARDLARMISVIAGTETPFYLAGHSFGGEPIAHYLAQGEGRRPRGVLFLSATPAVVDTAAFFHERMRTQIAMNRKIQSENPDLFEKIIKARVFIAEELGSWDDSRVLTSGLDMQFTDLPDWRGLDRQLDRILAVEPGDRQGLERALHSHLPFSDLMVYALDWSFQHAVSQKDLVAGLPEDITSQIEPWMLLEHRALMSAERQLLFPEAEQAFMRLCDEKLCGVTVPLDLDRLKEALRDIPALMLLGVNDPMVPFQQMRDGFAAISTSAAHHFEAIDGPGADHSSSYAPEALSWAMEKMKELEAAACTAALKPVPPL